MGRSVIVTGVADGIGRAVALLHAKAKDQLVLTDSDAVRGAALRDEIIEAGGTASFIQADLHKKIDVHNVIAETLEAYGNVQVLAHCASYFQASPLCEATEEDYDTIFDRNMRAAFLINRAVARVILRTAKESADNALEEAKSAAIVNVVSNEAVTATADHALFAASQGAVVQLTKAVALTLSVVGARANAVGIAGIKSELDDVEVTTREERLAANAEAPLARRGDPEEAAQAVYFLGSKRASFITGQTIFVDGGRLAMHRHSKSEG